MNTERATRAEDLGQCCGIHPQRVVKMNGKTYIVCSICFAHTSPDTPASARAQWLAMKEAQRAAQPKPTLTLNKRTGT